MTTNETIVAYLPYVHMLARRHSTDDEYISIAELALVQAVPKYDKERGASMEAFLYTVVTRAFKQYDYRDRMYTGGELGWIPQSDETPISHYLPDDLLPIVEAKVTDGADEAKSIKRTGLKQKVLRKKLKLAERYIKESVA